MVFVGIKYLEVQRGIDNHSGSVLSLTHSFRCLVQP